MHSPILPSNFSHSALTNDSPRSGCQKLASERTLEDTMGANIVQFAGFHLPPFLRMFALFDGAFFGGAFFHFCETHCAFFPVFVRG